MKIKRHLNLTAIALTLVCVSGAQAGDADRDKVELMHETTLSLIRLLVQQGVIKQEAADEMLKKAEQTAASKVAAARAEEQAKPANGGAPEKGVVRVTYVPEHVKREIRDQVRQEVIAQAKQERWGDVNAVPEWLDRLKWEGDFRLRYQGDSFAESNAPAPFFQTIGQNIDNTSEDRQRERIRLRLGLNAHVTPAVDVGVRITTGNTGDPVSTNQTLGTTANKYSLVLDRAFLKYTPLDGLSVSGGRIPNPFFSTDLVWDEDLNFEGLAVKVEPWANEKRELKPFIAAGIFPLQEIQQTVGVKADDKWLYGIQGGVEWTPSTSTRLKVGASYYDYRNISGIANPALDDTQFNRTAADSRQKGNSLFNIDNDGDVTTLLPALASDFKIANLTLVADFAHFYPLHITGTFDWARNVGYDRAETLTRTGLDIEPEVDGYQARLSLGYPMVSERHEWQAYVGYRYLERDAVLDAFTDSDFHLGGTNHKGFMVGGQYGIYKNTWLSARWMSSDQISGLPLSIDVLQLDLNAKF